MNPALRLSLEAAAAVALLCLLAVLFRLDLALLLHTAVSYACWIAGRIIGWHRGKEGREP